MFLSPNILNFVVNSALEFHICPHSTAQLEFYILLEIGQVANSWRKNVVIML